MAKLKFAVIAIAALLGITLFTGGTAQAQPSAVCGNAGSGYCLNDWGNGGSQNPVKMYYGGYANDYFGVFSEDICSGSHYVTPSCPFQHPGLDSKYLNDIIVEVQYLNAGSGHGLCAATSGGATAVLGDCVETGHAQDGVIMVLDPSCSGGYHLVDRYWSDLDDTTNTLTSGGNIGVQAYFATGSNTCWD